MTLNLQDARTIVDAALNHRQTNGMKAITIAVLDAGGHTKLLLREDGTSTLRPRIAHGKAYGAIALGIGSRSIYRRAQEQPYFVDAINTLAAGAVVPVPGGVLVRRNGEIVGAVGITGDSSDNDEKCAMEAIQAAGFEADCG